MSDLALQLALAVIPAILAITLHEAAHGYAALALGDDTARQAGRLSLNPLRHIDRFGTIILPGLLLFSQLVMLGRVAFMFGWAKPVPVSAWRFPDPRRYMALVALAGPAMNFVLAWLGALSLHVSGDNPLVLRFITYFILANIALGLFNLLPVPPLDGGRIMVGILPLPLARVWARLERAGIVLVLLVVFVVPEIARQMGYAFDPVQLVLERAMDHALRIVLALAGLHLGPAIPGGGDAV
ncbi:site-2 protease family protein [Acidisphaera rubrifaciens]|uniref:Peptidase M50 n=1 Tax=Acidisphaera rubrifaciens HS-AP3 TaxID=1231350 RepID=A0A0D6PAZ9_9PROT|nr:site-2 protease family protein [Acidisphaera rubrifaciens]GAN78044.1 peptidase M50 [Acidisphaera rubrifaciens HS-AP3]